MLRNSQTAQRSAGGINLSPSAGGHLHGKDVFRADFATVLKFNDFFGGEHLLQLRSGLARLRTVRLVCNDSEAFALRCRQLGCFPTSWNSRSFRPAWIAARSFAVGADCICF